VTVQEMIDSLDNYQPDQPVRLAVTHEGDGSSFTQVYEVASIVAGTADDHDVHIASGAAVAC
jgi:hypothetical protein